MPHGPARASPKYRSPITRGRPASRSAETFAVWLTPELDWRKLYAGWPALRKLEYVDEVMRDLRGREAPALPKPQPDYLPVESMQHTVGEHYGEHGAEMPFPDTLFDGDLQNLFSPAAAAAAAATAAAFLRSHRREIVTRVAYWTGEPTSVVRDLVDGLTRRAEQLDLRAAGLEAALLIELTAFLTAVVMNFRYADTDTGDVPAAGAA